MLNLGSEGDIGKIDELPPDNSVLLFWIFRIICS